MATLDAASYEIATYNWEYGPILPQPRPRHIVSAEVGQEWTYYYTQFYGWGHLQQNPDWFLFGAAPQYGSMLNLYSSVNPIPQQLGSQAAKVPTAAPTSGAYTGIPSGCGPSGMAGNPY